uniref:NADH-ubiquinone oxidoreductase chain 2 n=1 Tax=Mycocalicium subtile TaxID=124099 RepID=A0A286MUM3_9EURO|nr:NADH dehydrogenase subunit 2 [Mycocalicium subtile]
MLITSIFLLLLSNALNIRRDLSILFSRIGLIIALYCSFFTFSSLYIKYLDKGIGLLGGLFHTTPTTQIFHLFIFLISAIIIQLTSFYPRKVLTSESSDIKDMINVPIAKILNKMGEQFKITEYTLILLFIITGGVFLLSTSDLVSIFLSIELQSYGLYLLCTLYRNSELATSSGLTYFLLGGLSSCFILLGTSLLYANSGTTSLEALYIITSLSDTSNNTVSHIINWYNPEYLNYSLLIMSVGFLFKVSAAPFHFWSPDVYDGIPTIVTTFVTIIAKLSIFIFFLELVHYTGNYFLSQEFNWISGLLLSSLLSLIVGTVLGLTQFRIKRLFAYSTISHLGFILLALSINSIESIQAFIFYLMQYTISNLNAFIILISIGYSLYSYINNNKQYDKLPDKNNSPIQLLSQIKGYFYINPVLALSFAITIFSFVGIPPLVGFFAKQMVLSAALDSGYIFMSLVAIITSVISAVYYLGIIKRVFFDELEYKVNPSLKDLIIKPENIVLSSSLTITISNLTLIILLFIFTPEEWLNMANILSLILFNT